MVFASVHNDVIESSDKKQTFSASSALKHTKDLLASTTETTKSVFAHVGDSNWWRKVVEGSHTDSGAHKKGKWQGKEQMWHPFYGTNKFAEVNISNFFF